MPGPPPYASSSVERCLSDAKSRRSHTLTSRSPCLIPRAITPSARKASNIRGKIVTKSIFNIVEIVDAQGQADDDFLSGQIDLRADLGGERQFEVAARAFDIEQHATATLVGFLHDSALPAFAIDEREADEVVQKVLIRSELARFRFR